MNTSKAVWLKHPKHVITTLHSYLYEGKDSLCVMFILGEDGEMKLYKKSEMEARSEFLFLHTPNDYLIFSSYGIKGKLFTLDININTVCSDTIILKKKKKTLAFLCEDKPILEISNPAFLGSASLGVRAEGKGKTYIEVF